MNHLDLIISVGFRCVGRWHVGDSGLDFSIESEARNAKKSLYAFVQDSEVLYIGKVAGAFVRRMNGYRRPGTTQRTNLRVNPLLVQFVGTKKEVSIYHFQPPEEVRFRNIPLNIAAGLEDPLIETISPQWNMHGRKKDISREPEQTTTLADH